MNKVLSLTMMAAWTMTAFAGVPFPADLPPGAITVCSVGCDYTLIQDAVDNAEPGDTVVLGPETFYENVRATPSGPLTIRGMGPDATFVDGRMVDRAFVLEGAVTLIDLTVQHGHNPHLGAGVFASGDIRIENCVIRENHGCTDDRVNPLYGGAIYFQNGELSVVDSIIRDNTCRYGDGSAIALGWTPGAGTRALVESTTMTGNDGASTLIGAPCIGFPSATLDAEGDAANRLTVVNTTISGNRGRGVVVYGCLVSLENATITGNSGAGLRTRWGATLIASHSIVGPHETEVDCELAGGNARSLGHNLDTDCTCRFTHPTDLPPADPILLPLGDYGGPTPTHALHPDSPAIDAGSHACLPTDQRGFPRPFDGDFDGDPRCDIGAFEFGNRGGVEMIGALHDLILRLQGRDHELVAHVQTALSSVADADPSNDADAVRALLAFIDEVASHRGFTIDGASADALAGVARQIVAQFYGGSAAGDSPASRN